MAEDLASCIVPAGGSIRDALAAVDRGAAGIALAVDDAGVLVGVVTDGDLRRALLGGAALDEPLVPTLNVDFVSLARSQTRADALDLMLARHIDVVPVTDAAGRPVALHLMHAFLEPAARGNWAVIMAGGRGRARAPHGRGAQADALGRGSADSRADRAPARGPGVRRIFLSVDYLGEVIEEHFGNGRRFGCTIEYLREPEALGTAGSLSLLPRTPEATGQPFLVMNGDLMTQLNVGRLIDVHDAGNASLTMGPCGATSNRFHLVASRSTGIEWSPSPRSRRPPAWSMPGSTCSIPPASPGSATGSS